MLVQNPPFMLCRSSFYGPDCNRLSWSRATLPAVQTSPWRRPLHPAGWREIGSGCGVTILKGYRNVKGDTCLNAKFPNGGVLCKDFMKHDFLKRIQWPFFLIYPLVNEHSCWKSPFLVGTSTISTGPFSAMSVITRGYIHVYPINIPLNHYKIPLISL
jgi:hypothetical protein